MKKLKLLALLAALLLPMGLRAQETLTVNEGTEYSNTIPVYGMYVDTEGQCSEFIIPAESLAEMTGGTITKLTFYIKIPAIPAWTSVHNVYMKEVEGTTLSTLSGGADATVVYSGVLSASGTTMKISFTEDFQYNGGNLLIGEIVTARGTYKSASFYGVGNLTTGVSAYRTSTTGDVNTQTFLPKVTFEYTPSGGCRRPSGLAVDASATTTTSLTFGWTAPEGVSLFVYAVDEDADWTLTSDNPLTIDDLAPSTQHTLRVRSYCGYGDTSAAVSARAYTASDRLGIDEVEESAVVLYPNPATSHVTLRGVEAGSQVSVVDMNGRMVREAKANGSSVQLSLDGMAKGAYFVRIMGEKQSAIRKLIVK